jgi:hypothetical protein
MSSGTQVDMGSAVGAGNGAPGETYLSDEEILGIDPPSPQSGFGGLGPRDDADPLAVGLANASGESADAKPAQAEIRDSDLVAARATGGEMPAWMAAAVADPQHGGEAAALWRERQEFRAAFASPEEARAVKELLPGGVRDVLSLREATQSVERIDAALFSGDARAQAEVVAELARANPAAFRSLFSEAAKVLAGLVAGGPPSPQNGFGGQARGQETRNFDGAIANGVNAGDGLNAATRLNAADGVSAGPTIRENREGWGTQRAEVGGRRLEVGESHGSQITPRENSGQANHPSQELRASQSPVTNHESQITNHESRQFDAAGYATFERATNDAVARDVRGAIGDTLARVMPDGVADGAARRMGEDIFNEVHRALAADRALSEQVAGVLRDPPSPNGGYGGVRFGGAEQARVIALLTGRAKQLVPSVARRVIGEWTSSVLSTARSKAARQSAAASRVDIAAQGGSLDSMPLRSRDAGSAREVNYAAMSDEEILGI